MKNVKFKQVRTDIGYISVSPLPTAEELSQFYAELYYQERPTSTYQDSYDEEEMAHRRLRADLVVHAVASCLDRKPSEEDAFLEVGCDEGFVLASAERAGFAVHGIDFSDHAIAKFYPHLTDKFQSGDAYRLLDRLFERNNRYAVCALQNVLEHVTEPADLLDKMHRILAPGGVAVVTVPNDFSIRNMMNIVCDVLLPGESPERVNGDDSADQIVENSPDLPTGRPMAETIRSEL